MTFAPNLAENLAATHARAFVTDRPWSAAEFAALLNSPGVLLLGDATAFVLGRIVLDEAEVLTVATDPSAQRTGLARAALDQLEVQAKHRQVTSVFLEVAQDNTAAIGLYATAGYVQIGLRAGYYTRANAAAVGALILRKTL